MGGKSSDKGGEWRVYRGVGSSPCQDSSMQVLDIDLNAEEVVVVMCVSVRPEDNISRARGNDLAN